MKTLGIDVGKDSFSIAVISPEGELVAKLSCNLNSDGIESLRKSICPSDKVAVEASGPYSSIITAHIQNMGITPYLVNPLLAARFKQANSLRKTKTDSIDAISIARLSQSSSLQPAQGYLKEGIRLLERQIEATSRQIASLKNSILQTLHFLFPGLKGNLTLSQRESSSSFQSSHQLRQLLKLQLKRYKIASPPRGGG